MTFGVSRAIPNVPDLPLNDQHALVPLLKTADGVTELIPGVVSWGITTAPAFKEVRP